MKWKFLVCLAFLLPLAGCGPREAASVPVKQGEKPVEPAVRVTILPDRIADYYGQMSEEERVGQLFFVRCPETGAEELIEQYQPAGILFFGRDFDDQTPDSFREKVRGMQARAQLPLLTGVDEEGGTVTRVSGREGFRSERFGSPQEVFAAGGWEEIARDTSEKDRLLRSLGLNVNLAPVADVSTDPQDFMYRRAFGQDAQQTARYAASVVRQMRDDGIGSVLKHFPGYGGTEDTHTGIAVDERSLSAFRESDLVPFASAIQAGAEAVLVSHHVVQCMDDERPASLSPAVYRLLREELEFDGVAMTDDLAMGAVVQFTGSAEAAVQAVSAGSDLLLSSDLPAQYRAVLAAVQDGTVSEERLREAVCRVLRWKRSIGIWSP